MRNSSDTRNINDYHRNANKDKIKQAVNRFNQFLTEQGDALVNTGKSTLAKFNSGIQFDDLSYDDFLNDDLFGKFWFWLAQDAKYLNGSDELLSFAYTNQLASTLKEHIVHGDACRSKQTPVQFQKDRWSKTLHKIAQIKMEYCLDNDKPLAQTKETFTEADMRLLCSCLIYHPSSVNSQALHFTNCLTSFCGRGSDIADANFTAIYAEILKDSFHPFYHLGQQINRSKTQCRIWVS